MMKVGGRGDFYQIIEAYCVSMCGEISSADLSESSN